MLFVDQNLAKKVPGLRHNGHCNFKFKRKHYWKPAMSNVDSDMMVSGHLSLQLSEVQCGAGIKMLKKLDSLNNLRVKRAQKL